MAVIVTTKHIQIIILFAVVMNFVILLTWCSMDAIESEAKETHNDIKRLTSADVKLRKYLVILVMTAPRNIERRVVIRQTWKADFPTSVCTLFVVGKAALSEETRTLLDKEQSDHGDLMILSDFEDSYYRLTEKFLESVAKVVEQYNFTYLMKCDDDSFIVSQKLLNKLEKSPSTRLYMGYFTGNARVKKVGHWAEPNFHLCDRYLPYARGGGYILTEDLVNYITFNRKLLQIYNSEDVSLGIWLSGLSINRQHDKSFDTEALSRGCQNHHIVSHKQSIQDMKEKYKTLHTTGKLCKVETTLKAEYEYNWNVSPSECCKSN